MFRRLLYAKNLVLWAFVAPVCSVVALIIGTSNHDYVAMVITIIAITVMPFGVLGISAWVGIRFPYHPIPMQERWAHRRSWRHMWVRWLVLVVTPYGLVPALAFAFITPTLLLWGISAQSGLTGRLSDSEYALGVLMACGLSLIAAVFGQRARRTMGPSSQEEAVGLPGRSIPRLTRQPGSTPSRPACTVYPEAVKRGMK